MRLAQFVFAALLIAIPASLFGADSGAETFAKGPALPILAWGGIPYDKATPERYAELAGAGFTHTYNGAADAAMMEKLLDMGYAKGIRQLISFSELERDPEGTAKRFKDHPGMAGYYLRDEPGADLFKKLGDWAKRIQSVDKINPCYVNLLPTYGNPGQWGTPDYAKYVEKFIAEVPTPMVSWDHYPVYRAGASEADDRVRDDFYYNLEVCSGAARKTDRALWAFALSVAHNPYPVPTVTHLRLQAFSDLAYGAQVIQYFTYWTTKSPAWNFHAGPIESDGSRTPTYDHVKQVNGEIQALRGVFLGSKVISVGHTGKNIPWGTNHFSASGPVKSLETEGNGAVVSELSKEKSRFLVVVNRDLYKPMPLRATFDPAAAVKRVGKDGVVKPLGEPVTTLEPGDIAVFTWKVK